MIAGLRWFGIVGGEAEIRNNNEKTIFALLEEGE
jgi:hypothetical protein